MTDRATAPVAPVPPPSLSPATAAAIKALARIVYRRELRERAEQGIGSR